MTVRKGQPALYGMSSADRYARLRTRGAERSLYALSSLSYTALVFSLNRSGYVLNALTQVLWSL